MPVFLLIEIENLTLIWKERREAMPAVLLRLNELASPQIERFGGKIIKHRGDAIFAAFEAGNPLAASLAIQEAAVREKWGGAGDVRVRMAVHAGPAEKWGEDYFGPTVARAARILDIAWGGQTLVTPEAMSECLVPERGTFQDLGVHYLKDLNEPQRVYGFLHPDIPSREFPPLRSATNSLVNLPGQMTPFIGREKELEDIRKLLSDPYCRLLTLLGPGGIGKTRLAIQAAAEQARGFLHGVHFVDLAPLDSPGLIVSAVAQSLRFLFYGQVDPKSQLLDYLREKNLLIVLDNFEHLMEGVLLVTELLISAPGVKIIVTSRERLGVEGEWLFEIAGLEIPPGDGSDAEACGAFRLFVDMARRVSPGFSPGEEEASRILNICRLLYGMPLGIELAASWTRSLSCEEIEREISLSLNFLETPLRDAPERHRSLRAAFNHSWNLLSEYEKSALKKICVFKGGFLADAAHAVAGAALQILFLLADKSLLQASPQGRYEVHPMLSQFVEEQWEGAETEKERIEDLHSAYYAEFLRSREAPLKGGKQTETLAEIDAERENVRSAWTRLVEKKNSEMLMKALYPYFLFFRMQSRLHEGEETLGKAADALQGDPLAAHRLMACRARLCNLLGRFAKAKELLEECILFFGKEESNADLAFCRAALGSVLFSIGEDKRAGELLGLAAEFYRETGNRFEEALALNNLGNVMYNFGEYEKAASLEKESLSVCRAIGDKFGMSRAINAQGMAMTTSGKYAEANRLFEEGLELAEEIGDRRAMMIATILIGETAFFLGQYEKARSFLEDSMSLAVEIGDALVKAGSLQNLGLVFNAMGRNEQALSFLEESLKVYREDESGWGIATCLSRTASVAYEAGDRGRARRYFRESLEMAMEMRATPLIVEIFALAAPLLTAEGENETAKELIAIVFANPASSGYGKDAAVRFCAKNGFPVQEPMKTTEAGSPPSHIEAANRLLKLLDDRNVRN